MKIIHNTCVVNASYDNSCLNTVLESLPRNVSLLAFIAISWFALGTDAGTTAYFSTAANETTETTKTVNPYEIWQIEPDNGAGNRLSGSQIKDILSTSGHDFDAIYQDATHWYFSVQAGTIDFDHAGGSPENINSNKIVHHDKFTEVANIWFDAGTYTGGEICY